MQVIDWGVFRIHVGDCVEAMRGMATGSVQCCVTSPPYFGLRDYGHEGQIGLEPTPAEFVQRLVEVFREVRRVLRDDGTLWLNLGDSYAGGGGGNYSKGEKQTKHGEHITNIRNRPAWLEAARVKPKDLIGIPWRVALALQEDGWYLRQDIIWHKPNPMPESVVDRCTKAHEYLFLMSKSPRYYFDAAAMQEPAVGQNQHDSTGTGSRTAPPGRPLQPGRRSGNKERKPRPNTDVLQRGNQAGGVPWEGCTRNRRSVWTVSTKPFKGAHFATFPPDLIEPCVAAGSRPGDAVLDPFGGAGTTGMVAAARGRVGVLCEINPAYADLAVRRISTALFGSAA